MKIGLYTDAHFSLSSSIVIGSSGSFNGRLDLLIKNFDWMYKFFKEKKVDLIVNLGDLTNAPHLRAEEITALSTALSKNHGIEEIHILGNHEALVSDGVINSISFIDTLISKPEIREFGGKKVLFLPYRDYEDKDLEKYNADIVFGHLEIKGSKASSSYFLQTGIDPDFLSKKFGLVISGHTHRHSWVKNNVLNLGSISGLNFTSDGEKHYIGILDVDKKDVELIENPYALQFKKVDVESLGELNKTLSSLNTPENFAIQIRCPYDLKEDVRKALEQYKVGYARIVSKVEKSVANRKGVNVEKINSVEDGFNALYGFLADNQKSKEFSMSDIKGILKETVEHKS